MPFLVVRLNSTAAVEFSLTTRKWASVSERDAEVRVVSKQEENDTRFSHDSNCCTYQHQHARRNLLWASGWL